ncbi:unnamed protein product [Camellia sinensis]
MASATSISGFSSLNSICSSKSHIHSSLSSSFPLGSLHRQSHGSSVNRNPTFALVLNNNKFQRWRNMVRSVVEETLVPEETDQPVSALTMFFQVTEAARRERAITGSVRRAEGTMNEAAIRTVTNALEETEGVANLKVQVVEGIASVELTKETTIQATGVASNLVEIIQEFQIPWGSKIRISSAGNFRIVIRNQIMTMRAERKVLATNWNGLLCSKMESRVREAYSTGCTWIVSQSNEDIYEVHSFPTVLVDVGKRSCSCFQWQLNGFPCAHAVVAIQSSGRDFSTFVEQFFTVDQCKAAYSGYIQSILTVDKPSFSEDDFIIYSPAVKRPPGRPKKNRIPSRGERPSQIRRGRCGHMGSHNRKTCKEPI